MLQYAKEFEQNTGNGLSKFVSYLDRLKSNGSDLGGAADLNASTHNAVCVMSIHSSKGLEFPVCFVANTARRFISDTRENVLLHSKYGFAVKRRDNELSAVFNTMLRQALSLEIKRSEKSEELRILYVAMTRAKQKLIMLCSHNKLDSYISKISSQLASENTISPFVVRSATLLSDWIVMCALLHPDGECLRNICDSDVSPDLKADFDFDISVVDTCIFSDSTEDEAVDIQPAEITNNDVAEIIKSRSAFVYPYQALINLPSKVSASQLAHKMSVKDFDRILDKPAFMLDQKLTSAQRGTALHLFMQHVDFKLAREDFNAEFKRLIDLGYLSKAQADSIDVIRASEFINNDIITRCINSDRVFKEYRFTTKVDASVVDGSLPAEFGDEKIILQGAVDLAFVEDNSLVIVDYKTDRVKRAQELADIYSNQLLLYKNAMQQCTDYKVKECLIYSVYHSQSVSILK